MAAGLVKVAFLMRIEVFSWKGCQIREMRIWCLPGGLKILCNCMQFACNIVRTFQGLNHEFNTPAGGLAAWWRSGLRPLDSFFHENQGFRSEGLQKSENAILEPLWRIENPL